MLSLVFPYPVMADQTVSSETGVGVMYGESNPDTYFHVQAFGKSCYFAKDGEDKARALRAELESRYLDTGAAVGTIHIICNTTANIGSSSNGLFSFSANSDENKQGDVMTHEISHSIGRLGDEYDKKMQGENISDTSDPDKINVPKNSAYTLRSPDLYGYTCAGNSANQGEINITEDRQEITYYYRKNSEMPEIQTVPVRVTYDGKPHTFDIKQEDGVQISYSLTENGSYTQTEMPFYTEAGQYKIYFKAEKASFIPTYGEAVLEIEKASTSMQLTAKTDMVKGAGTVDLQLCKQGILEDAGKKVTCDVSGITLEEKETDHWITTLPNETKTYTFTACYNGNGNYTGSKADCKVRVTADHAKEEPGNVTPPSAADTSVSVKNLNVKASEK